MPKLRDQVQTIHAVPILVRVIDCVSTASLLSYVHRHVSALHEQFRIVTMAGVHGDTNTAVDLQLVSLQLYRLFQRAHDFARDRHADRQIRIRDQYRELVAAQARHRIRLAQDLM